MDNTIGDNGPSEMSNGMFKNSKSRILVLLSGCAAVVLALVWCFSIGPGAVSFNVWLLRTNAVPEFVRSAAVRRLLALGPSATPSLTAILDTGLPHAPNPLVIETIGGLRDPAAMPSLLRLLDSAEWNRDLLVWAIGRCGREDDAKVLVHCFRDYHPKVRARTVSAVCDLAPRRSFFVVLRGLQDTEAQVRTEARVVLERVFGFVFEADTQMPANMHFPESTEFKAWEETYRTALQKTRTWWMTESLKYPEQLEVDGGF